MKKKCNDCGSRKPLSAFRVATSTHGRADTCRLCEAGQRKCIDCQQAKPKAEMVRNSQARDGYRNLCKACARARYSAKHTEPSPVSGTARGKEYTGRKLDIAPTDADGRVKPYWKWTDDELAQYNAALGIE